MLLRKACGVHSIFRILLYVTAGLLINLGVEFGTLEPLALNRFRGINPVRWFFI